MQSVGWMVALIVVVSSFGLAFCALYLFSGLSDRHKKTARRLVQEEAEATVFVFDKHRLMDASDRAHLLLSTAPEIGSDWTRLLTILSGSYPHLEAELAELANAGQFTLQSRDEAWPTELRAEYWDGLLRLEISECEGKQSISVDRYTLAAMENELKTLRATADQAPYLIWQEARNGAVTWANQSYMDLARDEECAGEPQSWPPARIFDQDLLTGPTIDGTARRLSRICSDDTGTSWYDAFSTNIGGEMLHFAVSANAAVKAEQTLKEFVQTLTKTFAQLPIGLAIFDRQRRLALFNPALADLSTLPPEFLTAKPALFSFLDQLREKRMMPEPKDYKSWREELSALEAAATHGTYEETWSLPGGQTYRVSGRPHPDGAVAFLFTDISAEISLTRRFRSELEVGQAVVDALDEAIAVFAPTGVITMSNAAFANLWGIDPAATLGDFNIVDASRHWQQACEPNPIWGDIRESINVLAGRAEWVGEACMTNGRHLHCRCTPLAGGATLVGFSPDRTFELGLGDTTQAVIETA